MSTHLHSPRSSTWAWSRRELLFLAASAALTGLSLDGLGCRATTHRAPHHAPSHAHLADFVRAIRTSEREERRIRDQREQIRHRIRRHIVKARLQLARSPNAGSYAKRTGLIRYIRGKTKVGGQDVDLPFVLTHRSGHQLDLRALLDLFHGFVSRSYPRSEVSRTKSSIKLQLKTFAYGFDIVPMVAHPELPRHEYLYRTDGTKVLTSISGHVGFVNERTKASRRVPGVVAFNDMVRLFKWWREICAQHDIAMPEVPTFLLELLCSKVFDDRSVTTSYSETLHAWYRDMAEIVQSRREVSFPTVRAPEGSAPRDAVWVVRDPVNPDNLVVPASWTQADVDRLASWFRTGAENMARVEEHDARDDGKGALRELERLFGPLVRNVRMMEAFA